MRRWLIDFWAVWLFLLVIGVGVSCAQADDGPAPEGVRIQTVPNPLNPNHSSCVVFTHDTAQGASIAVMCGGS